MSNVDDFDARQYFLDTIRWINQWPRCATERFEAEGFTRIQLEQIEPHPVWHLRMRAPSTTMTSGRAGQMIRKVVEQSGRIPRGGFSCSVDGRGHVEAAFVLEV